MAQFEKETDFYNNTIFSEKGHLYQMAYADNAAYNSPFKLHLRTKDGWVVFLKNQSLSNKYNSEKNLNYNIGSFIIDSERRYALSFSGHWYSRKITENIVEKAAQYLAYANNNFKAENPHLHVLKMLRRELVHMHSADGLGISAQRTAHVSTYPVVGHATVYISPDCEGFLIYPSGKFSIANLVYVGGYSSEIAESELKNIFELLNIEPSECFQETWDRQFLNFSAQNLCTKLQDYDKTSTVFYITNNQWTLKR